MIAEIMLRGGGISRAVSSGVAELRTAQDGWKRKKMGINDIVFMVYKNNHLHKYRCMKNNMRERNFCESQVFETMEREAFYTPHMIHHRDNRKNRLERRTETKN